MLSLVGLRGPSITEYLLMISHLRSGPLWQCWII